MALSNSLYLGYSGMYTHQQALDNLGNNLANVNTVGYKTRDFAFSSMFSQALNGGNLPADGNRSTVGPKSLGMGVMTGAITTNFRAGPVNQTGNPLDLAIGGNGFFLARTSSGMALTRDGSMYNDANGLLCVGSGLAVQGWMAQNGMVNPSTTVGDIHVPTIGTVLQGRNTSEVIMGGVLPTRTNTSEFNGNVTNTLSLKGDMSAGNTINTSLYLSTSQTGSDAYNNRIEEVKVQITFDGPNPSAEGNSDNYTWTMTTVDWPNAGDPPVQIYPVEGDPTFSRGTVGFYNHSSNTGEYGAGQPIRGSVSPGGTRVSAESLDADGNPITKTLTVISNFSLDVSRLTNIGAAPGGDTLTTWSVNGNPAGTVAKSVTMYDTQTTFVKSTDANGNVIVTPQATVEARETNMIFEYLGSDDDSRSWAWYNDAGDSGTLTFDTNGELVGSTGNTGTPSYNFDEMRNINYQTALEVVSQDGYREGEFRELSIDANGKIYARYSNEITELVAQLAIGNVQNPAGLTNASSTLFYTSPASGELLIGIAGDAEGSMGGLPAVGAGKLVSGALEGSNVDMTMAFAELITTERGYQLNSRVISTSNEMLQTLLNTKR